MAKNKPIKLVSVLATFLLAVLSTTFISAGVNAAANDSVPLKIGFITVGPANDWGYNYAHDQGRRFIDKSMPGQVQTTIAEKIPETAEVERVIEKMIASGIKLIFSTSYGYLEPMMRAASRHPNVIFESCGRVIPNDTKNAASYSVKQYEPMYIAGVVAGRMTKKSNLGFIAAHPIPQVLQDINAFTLGLRSVNNKAKVHVIWTNSWSDPATEAEAAKGLIESGIDVLAMHLDSPLTVVQTAEKHGIMSVGFHADLKKFAPKGWLTGQKWNWGPLYVNMYQSVINGTWKPGNPHYGMKDGYVDLSSFGARVPKNIQEEALSLKKKIESGEYVVFHGPLKDRDGIERIPASKTPDTNLIDSMNWLVSGVEGSLSKR